MTKEEAIEQMKKGNKVTHFLFTDEEYITMKGDEIIDELGYYLNADAFWSHRRHEAFACGWKLYE